MSAYKVYVMLFSIRNQSHVMRSKFIHGINERRHTEYLVISLCEL